MYKDEYDQYFGILGLTRGATLAEVTEARKRLLKEYHEDALDRDFLKKAPKWVRDEVTKKMQELNDAVDQAKFYIKNEASIPDRPRQGGASGRQPPPPPEDENEDDEPQEAKENKKEQEQINLDDMDQGQSPQPPFYTNRWVLFGLAVIAIFFGFRFVAGSGGIPDFDWGGKRDEPARTSYRTPKTNKPYTRYEDDKGGRPYNYNTPPPYGTKIQPPPPPPPIPAEQKEKGYIWLEFNDLIERRVNIDRYSVDEIFESLNENEREQLYRAWGEVNNLRTAEYWLWRRIYWEREFTMIQEISPERWKAQRTSYNIAMLRDEYSINCSQERPRYSVSRCEKINRDIYNLKEGKSVYIDVPTATKVD